MKKIYLHSFLLCLTMLYSIESIQAKGNMDWNLKNHPVLTHLKAMSSDDEHAKKIGKFNQTVTGNIVDELDQPLPGVTVTIKELPGVGTITNMEGSYTINIPDTLQNGHILFSFVGYITKEVAVNGQTEINAALLPDIQSLEEVVVVGYGTQKKSDLTGSVTAVSSKDFNQGFVPTPEQLISGKVPGVQITSNGGAPGSGSQIRIRGGASLNATNDPLIVIDGVPVSTSSVSGSPNPLSFVNPNDIETFNILKDASATAIYGSRASNGVIIITTKRGESGQKLRVNVNTQHSLSTVIKTVPVLSADEFRNVVNERGTEAQQALLGDANTNWQDQIYRPAYTTDNNISLSGAIKSLPYRVSLGYLNQQGILKSGQFERISGAVNLNPTFLDDHLKVNLNLRSVFTDSRFAPTGAIGSAVAMDPTKPIYGDYPQFGGYYQWADQDGLFNPNATVNPLSMLDQYYDQGQVRRTIGNLQLDYKFHFLPDLRANLNLGFDDSRTEGEVYQPENYAPVVLQGGSRRAYGQTKTNQLLEFYLNYVKELEEIDSKVDVTGGYSYQDFTTVEPNYPTLNLEGDTISQGTPTYPQNRLVSFFGRINYTFKERYLLTATVRQDGSSRFSSENRWGTFPSLALAWRINEENFLINSKVVSELKLRLGYGLTGQQDVTGDFPYLARYTYSDPGAGYQFGNTYYTMYRPEAYDPNIKWEETRTYNTGVDFGFINGRISGSLDYYLKQTSDLLSIVPVAAGTNFTNQILTNVGNIETKGLEAVVNFVVVDNQNFSLNLGLNGTYNDIKITNLSKVGDNNSVGVLVGNIGGGTGQTVQVHSVGYAPYSYYVYKQVYDENGQPIENLFADLNGDGSITEADRYRYQSPNPKFYYGFNGNASYKNWSLGFVMRGNTGNYLYNNINSQFGNYANITSPGYLSNLSTDVFNTNFANRPDELLLSDYYVQNGSFLRMENINLAYNFGNIIKDQVGVKLSGSVQNAFLITNYTGLDPEIPTGIDNNFYPRPRVFSLGLNVNF